MKKIKKIRKRIEVLELAKVKETLLENQANLRIILIFTLKVEIFD